MTASRQGRERTFYLYWRGFRGGEGGIFSSENYGNSRVLGPGAAPPGPICSHSGEERISGRKEFGKKKSQVFSLFLSLFVFPSFDSDPGPLARPVPPAGQEFLAGGNIPGGGKRDG